MKRTNDYKLSFKEPQDDVGFCRKIGSENLFVFYKVETHQLESGIPSVGVFNSRGHRVELSVSDDTLILGEEENEVNITAT